MAHSPQQTLARQRQAPWLTSAKAAPRAIVTLAAVLVLLAARAGAAPCRMQNGAQHEWCGLPFELSNFQVRKGGMVFEWAAGVFVLGGRWQPLSLSASACVCVCIPRHTTLESNAAEARDQSSNLCPLSIALRAQHGEPGKPPHVQRCCSTDRRSPRARHAPPPLPRAPPTPNPKPRRATTSAAPP